MISRPFLAAILTAATAAPAFAVPRIESHAIECKLDPDANRIDATDRLAVHRDNGGPLVVTLNSGLLIVDVSVDGASVKPERLSDNGWTSKWRLDVPAGGTATSSVTFHYAGLIADQVKKSTDLSFVVGDDTRGVICPDGVYLCEGSGWYPSGDTMSRFDVKAEIPEPYLLVTQGTHSDKAGFWTGKYDADGLALVAGKWKHEERKTASGVVIGTYLTETNAASAKLLLDATEGYLKKYSDLLGPYAYDRFDIVENWFTTGYGMPEFTLLGRDVIARMVGESQRTGSIPNGYLDHEIVHSWWGNLVFPDFESGNWCEGLTTYCANYYSQELLGPDEARESRRRTILRYTIGATPERDYPVRKFVTKTEDIDNDVGYGKCSMMFHALRRDLGDAAFWETLRRVAKESRGKRFTWDDWRREFETTSKRNLAAFFAQALDRADAPTFSVAETSVSAEGGRLRVSGTLVQSTAGEGESAAPWRVTVPVVVEHLAGREEFLVDCASNETRFSLIVPSLPLRVTVDPDFHVFRRLAVDEVPPCLAATLAMPSKTIVYPDGDEPMKAAAEMAASRSNCEAVPASTAPIAPAKGMSYVVFGDAKRVPLLASLAATLPRHFPSPRAPETTTVLATSRSPVDPMQFVTTFVGAPAAASPRARAVFYYQYDGRIVFDGRVPKERTQTPTVNHATRTLLPDVKAASSPEDVRKMIDFLASPEMNGRLAGGPEEKKVRAAITEQFTLAGLPVEEQAFSFTVKTHFTGGMRLDDLNCNPADLLPLVASPSTDKEEVHLEGIETSPEADLKGRALMIDVGAAQEDVLTSLRGAADMAKHNGAVALFVRLPESPTKAVTDLLLAAGPKPVPNYALAGVAARTQSTRELSLPTLGVPHGFPADKPNHFDLEIAFETKEIATSNVVARVKALGKQRRPGVVVLGAHYDHLGAGFPGADDDASGIAALTEAARILSAHADLLGRDVVLVAFGAEEWGLRGSKAFVERWPKDQPIVAMIEADTVGRRGIPDVSVVGVSKYPRLAQVMSAALEQANLDVGKDIDKYAFAYGSDHWSFHEAGIPAVDLWSGDYAVMHTANDTADGVDEMKVSRIGRALAMAALGISGGF